MNKRPPQIQEEDATIAFEINTLREGEINIEGKNLYQENQKAPQLEEVVKTKQTYHKYYRNANFFSKILFFYCLPMINAVNKNNGNMTEEMIIDMSIKDDETEKNTACFKKLMK